MLDDELVGPRHHWHDKPQQAVQCPSRQRFEDNAVRATTATDGHTCQLTSQPHMQPVLWDFGYSTALREAAPLGRGGVNMVEAPSNAACSPLPEQPSRGDP